MIPSSYLRTLLFALTIALIGGCASSKKLATKKSNIETVIRTARSYTGTPYKWGGTSRQGIDCSGLLLNSFAAIKMNLPRTSIEQSKIGKKVSLKEIDEGDLVFFAAGKKKNKITHAGLVTAIQGKDNVRFIHSSTSKGVIEANLMSRYYQGIFVKAVRVF